MARKTRSRGNPRFRLAPRLALMPVLALLVLALGPVSSAPGYETRSNVSYDLGSPPADPARNWLDVYLPEGDSVTPRPFIMHIHGGGWKVGDKANASIPDKARLFTGLGYGLVSINYRLSPQTGDPANPDPDRIMFPDHPDDVGEAIGWLDRNALAYGLDPDRMIVMGHSAGAHLASLVATDPRYIERYGVDRRQILGAIPLDTGAFDIQQSVLGSDPDEPSLLFMNAFGTPEENAASGSWAEASPLTWADASDPRHLFLVQNVPSRINKQLAMATKLGQESSSVVALPLNHNGINLAIGNPADTTQASSSVTAFVGDRLDEYEGPSVRITGRPAGTVFLKRKGRAVQKKKVSFRFSGSGNRSGFQCSLDGSKFGSCNSPVSYRIGPGGHTFRVRPLYPSGRPGPAREAKLTAKVKSVR